MFKKVTIPLYSSTLVIGLDETQLVVVDKLNKSNPGLDLTPAPHAAATTYSALWAPNKGVKTHFVFVCFGEDSIDVDTVVHETVHVVNSIFNHIGQKLDSENDEAQAYLTGWVADQIYNLVQEYNNKKIKKDGKPSKVKKRK